MVSNFSVTETGHDISFDLASTLDDADHFYEKDKRLTCDLEELKFGFF